MFFAQKKRDSWHEKALCCLNLAPFFYSELESYINQIDVEQKFKVANIIVLNVNISTIKLSNFRN
jgi:hypothetical protein